MESFGLWYSMIERKIIEQHESTGIKIYCGAIVKSDRIIACKSGHLLIEYNVENYK